MIEEYRVLFLSRAREYIDQLSYTEQAILAADVEIMRRGDIGLVYTKQLRGPIRELISGNHRLVYFFLEHTIRFVDGFRKKSAKTPKSKIDFAEKIYKILKAQ
jgi:phage-related protein